MFFKGSRYENVPTAELVESSGGGGRRVLYKKMRVIGPAPAQRRHTVTSGERLDLIADRYFHNPERFWRICDCNGATWPADLVARAGKPIGIPSSEE